MPIHLRKLLRNVGSIIYISGQAALRIKQHNVIS